MNNETVKLRGKVRLQDIVAKSTGVNLEHTVRVLNGLVMVATILGEHNLANDLYILLKDSARVDGFPEKLLSKPGPKDGEYCEKAYDAMWEVFGKVAMVNLKTMNIDTYYRNKMEDLKQQRESMRYQGRMEDLKPDQT